MPLVTFEDRIEQALTVAKTFRGSPAESHVAVLKVLGFPIESATHLDAVWREYYASESLAEVARLYGEVAALQRKVDELTTALGDHEPLF